MGLPIGRETVSGFTSVRLHAVGHLPIQMTKNGAIYAIESDDRRFLYYAKYEGGAGGLWKMPLGGGEETRVLGQPVNWWEWVLAPTGIYFLDENAKPNGRIEFFEFATGEMTPIFSLEKPVSSFGGLTISPDGKSILYGQSDLDDAYIMLVKNFH